ncbi:Trichome birefringence-like, N-terminal domain [Dillenia turbinata]|uniref:Trichome birefringence-like, N-terminal domain n=1 Tax=Dillenia turbinata TaxID=194707 RepID=A0AAN8V5P5_9MAGN
MKAQAAIHMDNWGNLNHKLGKSSPRVVPLAIILLLVTTVILYYPFLGYPLSLSLFQDSLKLIPNNSSSPQDSTQDPSELKLKEVLDDGKSIGKESITLPKNNHSLEFDSGDKRKKCNLFSGEWIWNPGGPSPYYTNETCYAIQDHQNCMRNGRPDSDFLKWKWKPHECELPDFDGIQFLEILRGKSLAFVGDSISRNHFQSLVCLLAKVEYPEDHSTSPTAGSRHLKYKSYNFTMSVFWTPYLVKTMEEKSNGTPTGIINIYLDEFDEEWTSQIWKFDYVIISAGQWFFRPIKFYEQGHIVGCQFCRELDIPHLSATYGYQKAFQTAFKAINTIEKYKGCTFLRTLSVSHFEDGPWDKGGNCVRKRPFRKNETSLKDYNVNMYNTQMKEFRVAKRQGWQRGLQYRLMNTTQVMLLRPDGHPSIYWQTKKDNRPGIDCVHWCLPGPIDTWNEFLLEMFKMEEKR